MTNMLTQNPSEDAAKDGLAERRLLHDLLGDWAERTPNAQALLSVPTGRAVNWHAFDRYTLALAARLKQMGLGKGDCVVTLLPVSVDYIMIAHACFRLGAVVAPLPLGIAHDDLLQAVAALKPRAFFALGVKAPLDLRPLWASLCERAPDVTIRVAVDSAEPVPGAATYGAIHYYVWRAAMTCASINFVPEAIHEHDPALAIHRPTPQPPARLTHGDLKAHVEALGAASHQAAPGLLHDLPAAHVASQTLAVLGALFNGQTALLAESID